MKLWDEFKAFAFKGNMLDLAIAVVIGVAFGKVISSLVSDVIMPLVGLIPLAKDGYQAWMLGPVKIGIFLGSLLDFLIVAAAVFLVLVKVIGSLTKKPAAPAAPPPAVKECPMCLSVIPQKARKCAHCTSDLP
jgi:large conductance mechanosensitive channel